MAEVKLGGVFVKAEHGCDEAGLGERVGGGGAGSQRESGVESEQLRVVRQMGSMGWREAVADWKRGRERGVVEFEE